MNNWDTQSLVADDKKFVWHSFTLMGTWCDPEHEPLVLASGEEAIVRDCRGREYIDGNSSIRTNIHGHNHPRINAAIRAQLGRTPHTSFLGVTNPPATKVMTGFGRTGKTLACEHEARLRHIDVFAKQLTSSYLLLVLTLISHKNFEPSNSSKPAFEIGVRSQSFRLAQAKDLLTTHS
jgi:adenosylmethionine-8-amino-7-oxononanoate aminotransferase